jgi:hypothetical protein
LRWCQQQGCGCGSVTGGVDEVALCEECDRPETLPAAVDTGRCSFVTTCTYLAAPAYIIYI